MGRVLGGIFNTALSSIARQAEEAARAVADLQERTERLVVNSPELQRALHHDAYSLLPPVSQSAYSTNVNGRVQSRLSLVMPLADSRGHVVGQAEVNQVTKGDVTQPLVVDVQLASGKKITIKENESSARVIDVEWHEVK